MFFLTFLLTLLSHIQATTTPQNPGNTNPLQQPTNLAPSIDFASIKSFIKQSACADLGVNCKKWNNSDLDFSAIYQSLKGTQTNTNLRNRSFEKSSALLHQSTDQQYAIKLKAQNPIFLSFSTKLQWVFNTKDPKYKLAFVGMSKPVQNASYDLIKIETLPGDVSLLFYHAQNKYLPPSPFNPKTKDRTAGFIIVAAAPQNSSAELNNLPVETLEEINQAAWALGN